jgi:hypothetical protein
VLHPSFSAIDPIAAHCDPCSAAWSWTIRTARSRTSGEYLVYHEEGLLIVPLMFAGIGAAAGALIDALIPGKKVLVYSAPSASSAARVSVSPLVSRGRQGVAVSVRF